MFDVISVVCLVVSMSGEPDSSCWVRIETARFATLDDCVAYRVTTEPVLRDDAYKYFNAPVVADMFCAKTGQPS